jgi:hypothetical protein
MQGVANPVFDAPFSIAGHDAPIAVSIHTPYQLLFLERLLACVSPRPTLIVDQRPEKYRLGRKPQTPGVQVLEAAITGRLTDPDQQRLMREVLDRIDAFANHGAFTFVCPSFGWPFNNIALTRWRRRGDVRFAIIEDGLSTYLQTSQSWKWQLRNLALEIVGRVRGYLPRTLFGGHPLGLDLGEVQAIFVGSDLVIPERGSERYIAVPPLAGQAEVQRDPAAALFVGQPYLRDYGEDAIVAFIDKAFAWLRSQGVTRMALKPHHFQTPEEIALYLDRGCTLLDPPVTIEELIGGSDYGILASSNTTALMTTKSMLGPAIRTVAINPTAFSQRQETRDPAEVVAIFRRFGVEVVEL